MSQVRLPRTEPSTLLITAHKVNNCDAHAACPDPGWLELRRLPPNQGFCEGSLLRNEPQYPMGYALHSGRGGGSNSPQCTVTPSHRAPKRLVSVVTVVKLVCCFLELR